jgi:hypothetical protein
MRRYHRLIENQLKGKVATHAYQTNRVNKAWFVTLAVAFAGFFYFFAETLWRALTGG